MNQFMLEKEELNWKTWGFFILCEGTFLRQVGACKKFLKTITIFSKLSPIFNRKTNLLISQKETLQKPDAVIGQIDAWKLVPPKITTI